MIDVGATLNERFTLEKRLGQGGMGTVYRATDQLLGRTVAIKLLIGSGTEEVARMVRIEAQILARLVHDGIVRLYDFGESGGHCYLVMEEVDGSSFADRLGDLSLADRLRICGQVAGALHYAHLQGVIHRDVKPGNVLLTPGDEAKLSDFGLSLVTDDGKEQSGTVRGTAAYMSPEQVRGETLDHRTDLYSVGVMLYECVTGDVPFVGPPICVIGQHLHTSPPRPSSMNPEVWSTLEHLILSLLEKDRSKRPAAGSVVALALIEEAERARRLERINLGPRRSDPRAVADPSATSMPTAVLRGEGRLSPSNGPIGSATDAAASQTPASAPSVHPRPSESGAIPASRPESTRGPTPGVTGLHGHPIAAEMLARLLVKPIVISPKERYLCGHYLAYLLGGSRRRGVFVRRALDAKNADRARLLLAMTWLAHVDPTDDAIGRAASLLDERPDVRSAVSPAVVVKYLASRGTPAKRRRFRQLRTRLQEACAHAQKAMLDHRGLLNPGMMPRTLDDLETIAPIGALDAHRVSLWNRISEVWRQEEDFRRAVLRYATRSDHLESAGADLWPEVVYPLIERTHWQRTSRPRYMALWEYLLGTLLRVPLPGVRLDRILGDALPPEVARQLDDDLDVFIDDFRLDEAEEGTQEILKAARARPIYVGGNIPREEEYASDDEFPTVGPTIPLTPAEPFRVAHGVLRAMWEGAIEEQTYAAPTPAASRTLPVGPYCLAVVPTIRGRSAVRAVLKCRNQGKEIEIMTPILGRTADARTVIAIWVYQDESVAVAHLDFQSRVRYIFWHATKAHQVNFAYPDELRLNLSCANLEVPEAIEQTLRT